MTYPIKPVDTVRTAKEMLPADMEGVEGRWLDLPRLQQRNPDENQSNFWCGRACASMIVDYYLKFGGKTDQYIGHNDGEQGIGPNGCKKNLRFLGGDKKDKLVGINDEGRCWPEGAFSAMDWKTDSGELVKNLQGIKPTDDAYIEKVFKRHIAQLKKNNPVLQYTQLSEHRGHVVVVGGYKKDDKGRLWLRLVDPGWPNKQLLGPGNFQIITESTQEASCSEYWLRAGRLLDIYPGRPTRLFSHADALLGLFQYILPDKPVPDDHELVHYLKKGAGAEAGGTPMAASGPAPAGSSSDAEAPSSGSPQTTTPAPDAAPGEAPTPAACPPVSGNSRLPFEVNGSSVVTGEAITSLYHMSERGLGGFFPLGDAGLFHCGAHFAINDQEPLLAIADGELVAARLGLGPGAHAWGDTGFVLLRHKVKASGADKNVYSLFMHLKREPLHPDHTKAPWLKLLLEEASKDPDRKDKWRILAKLPTWKPEYKGRFSPANVSQDVLLDPGVYEEQEETVQDQKRFVKLKDKWVRVSGVADDEKKAKELSAWSDFDLEKAAKNSALVKALKEDKVAVFDTEKDEAGKHKYKVGAGETLGVSGAYLDGPTLHWTVFTKDEVFPGGALPEEEFTEQDPVKLATLDLNGKDHGKPEHTKALIEALDKVKKFLGTKPEDSILEPGELRLFYRTPTHCWKTRYQAVKSLVDFKLDVESFVKQDRYKSHTADEKKSFTDNAKTFLFWDELASAEEFPTDGKAIFVHPATALRLMSAVSVAQDHDDPVSTDASAPDRLHPAEDITLIVRDSKGPLAAVNLTVKSEGKEIRAGATDSAGELVVRLEDAAGKAIEVQVDPGAMDGGQLYNVVNETGSPSSLMPGTTVGAQTTNGSDIVPCPRLGLRVKSLRELRGFAGWDESLHQPKGATTRIPKDQFLEIERFVFRRDDGKFEAAQVSFEGKTLVFWSIDEGEDGLALAPADNHAAGENEPNVLGTWSMRIAHLTDQPVLAGRVMNIGDGEELSVTWKVMLSQGASEHDIELMVQKCKTVAKGFCIAFDPHALTQDNQLLNTPKGVYAVVKYKDKTFSLRDQSVTCYGENPVVDPGTSPESTASDGKFLVAVSAIQRGGTLDKLTLWDRKAPSVRSISQLSVDLQARVKADGFDRFYAGPVVLLQHLATEGEETLSPLEALKHQKAATKAVFPDAPDQLWAPDDRYWSSDNGIRVGICARDCKAGVEPRGTSHGCTEAIRQQNLGTCHTAAYGPCQTAIKLGSAGTPHVPKEGKCGAVLGACGTAHHEKSGCFLDGTVRGANAEERERWYVALPMRLTGTNEYVYSKAGRAQQLHVLLVNPANGRMVVCSQEDRGPSALCTGNPAVPEASIVKNEFLTQSRMGGVSYETAWSLQLPKSGGDAVVLMAFVGVDVALGPVPANLGIKLREKASVKDVMGPDFAGDDESTTTQTTQTAPPDPRPSGRDWTREFPGSRATDALCDSFRPKVEEFIAALKAAGANVSIAATLRPELRAFLMHHSCKVAKGEETPAQVPQKSEVPIGWDHGSAASSKRSAQEMVDSYGIAFPPALTSRHIQGRAIDMNITWSGVLNMKYKDGRQVGISAPANGAKNSLLWDVGKSYGVIKLTTDPPHWSEDGK